jgi:hypothetical protein
VDYSTEGGCRVRANGMPKKRTNNERYPNRHGQQPIGDRRKVSPMSRVNQDGKRDNQDGKFFEGSVFEPCGSDLTRLEAI